MALVGLREAEEHQEQPQERHRVVGQHDDAGQQCDVHHHHGQWHGSFDRFVDEGCGRG